MPYKVVNDHRSFINPIVLQFVSTSAMQSTPKHDKLPIYKQAFKQLTSLGIILLISTIQPNVKQKHLHIY